MSVVADLVGTGVVAPLAVDAVVVGGADAVSFLQGQLGADVAALEVGAAVRSLLLQPQGKVDAWLWVWRRAHDVVLTVDAGWGDAVVARLSRFRIRVDVTFAQQAATVWSWRWPLDGPRPAGAPEVAAGDLVADAGWPGVAGVDRLELAGDGGAAPDDAGPESERLDAVRIACGVPRLGAELDADTIPAEAGRWLVDASVSFTKGCYVGQELVARVDSRGSNTPRHLRGLVSAGPIVAGSEVQAGDASVGVVSSAAAVADGWIGLALLRRAVEPGDTVVVGAADGDPGQVTASVRDLPLD